MKRLISILLAGMMTMCLVIASERRAWGYVDPGTGLIAMQTVASVAAAYLYMIRRRLRSLFGKKQTVAVDQPAVLGKTGSQHEAV